MNNKIYTVASLTDYINLIQKEKLQSYYFRGENDKYECISSSLVRDFRPSETDKLDEIYDDLLSRFYLEVGNDINYIQKEYFIAFAQHHGLKTNLIDFTTAPLVALYFACDNNQQKNDCGYVYLLNNESTVDATDSIEKISFKQTKHYNTYAQIANDDTIAVNEYRHLMHKYNLLCNQNVRNFKRDNFKLFGEQDFCTKCKEYISARCQLNEYDFINV